MSDIYNFSFSIEIITTYPLLVFNVALEDLEVAHAGGRTLLVCLDLRLVPIMLLSDKIEHTERVAW